MEIKVLIRLPLKQTTVSGISETCFGAATGFEAFFVTDCAAPIFREFKGIFPESSGELPDAPLVCILTTGSDFSFANLLFGNTKVPLFPFKVPVSGFSIPYPRASEIKINFAPFSTILLKDTLIITLFPLIFGLNAKGTATEIGCVTEEEFDGCVAGLVGCGCTEIAFDLKTKGAEKTSQLEPSDTFQRRIVPSG